MKISILLCTYNGEKYILEQLESIKRQTLLPSEIKIYDDCSSDDTVAIIGEYSKNNSWTSWEINVNEHNKGWRLNFYDAINACDGDIIFFCDQDDIWFENKIEVMVDTMAKNSNILTLSGLQFLIDAEGKNTKHEHVLACGDNYNYSLKKSPLLKNIQGISWQNRVGCAMAIKKELKEQLEYFERDNAFAHDLWAVNLAALLDGCYYINFPAIKYRLHGDNASVNNKEIANASKLPIRQRKLNALQEHSSYLLYLQKGIESINSDKVYKKELKNLCIAVRLFQKREITLEKRSILHWLTLAKYIGIIGLRQYIGDLLDVLGR